MKAYGETELLDLLERAYRMGYEQRYTNFKPAVDREALRALLKDHPRDPVMLRERGAI